MKKIIVFVSAFALALTPVLGALPLLLTAGTWVFRALTPLTHLGERYIVARAGQTAFSYIQSAEMHAWIGAALGAVYYTNKDNPPSSTEKPVSDGMVIWLEDAGASKYMNPDSSIFNDASSGNKQPTPKGSFDKADGLPQMPSTMPAAVQSIGGGVQGSGKFRHSQGSQTKNVISEVWFANVDIALSSVASYQRCAQANTARPAGAPATNYQWCGSVSVNGASNQYAVWQQTKVIDCPAGFSKDSTGLCNLTNAAEVTKPADHPCEIIQTSAGWEFDPKNPNCAQYSAKTKKTINSVQMTDTDSAGNVAFDQTFTANPDGTIDHVVNDAGGTRWTHTFGPDGSGGHVVTGSGSGPGSTVGAPPGSGTGTGGTGGTGTGTTGSGTGGGACGAAGLPDCRIDDSGFAGKLWEVTGVKSLLDGAAQLFSDRVTSETQKTHGISKDSFFSNLRFGLPRVTCQNPDLHFQHLGFNIDLDICGNWIVQTMKSVEAWLLGIYTTYYVWRRFMSSELTSKVD